MHISDLWEEILFQFVVPFRSQNFDIFKVFSEFIDSLSYFLVISREIFGSKMSNLHTFCVILCL